jgi:hypothetical protein
MLEFSTIDTSNRERGIAYGKWSWKGNPIDKLTFEPDALIIAATPTQATA